MAKKAAAKLSPKMQRFIKEYIIDRNGTKAYLRAGYKCSEGTARRNAYKLLMRPEVASAVDKAEAERLRRVDIKADDVLREIAKLAFSDIKNYLSFRTEKTVVGYDEDSGEPIFDYAQVIQMKDSTEVDGSVISEVSLSKDGVFKFKLQDKKAPLEMLAKHLKLFVDHSEVEVVDKTPRVDMKQLSVEELKRLASMGGKTGGDDDGESL